MDLNQFSDFIKQRREKFKEDVLKEAEKLNLEDIKRAIESYPVMFPFDGDFSDFTDGREIGLRSSDRYYTVRINPDQLILEAGGYEIRIFEGEDVESLYNGLAERIIEEGDLPF